MSAYDKVVKMACKPTPAPPKSKYMDNIIAATYSEDGAVRDVCIALAPKIKEPNVIVVFKALIVLHTMIRNGATENVLAYLSSSEVLPLRNVSNGKWKGYTPPQNFSNYAHYLDARIRAYRDLKHDPIRVQAESNRELRVGQMDEENRRSTAGPSSGSGGGSSVQRSKTIMGRKLRVMTVEKGLLTETKIVQKLIDTLLDCRFYLDDLKDELTTTALRLLVKDILVLFQACNEGVINALENYFEMSQVDATAALGLYRQFCKQAERVVDYLDIARKLEGILNVPIPNIKHAPVSLAGALEEYLNDPNFEQNRIEYKTNKEIAARSEKQGKGILNKPEQAKSSSTTSEPTTTTAITFNHGNITPTLISKSSRTTQAGFSEDGETFNFLNIEMYAQLEDIISDNVEIFPFRDTLLLNLSTMTILYQPTSGAHKINRFTYSRVTGRDDLCQAILSPDGNILVRRQGGAEGNIEAISVETKQVIAVVHHSDEPHNLIESVWISNIMVLIPNLRNGVVMQWDLGHQPKERLWIFQPVSTIMGYQSVEFHSTKDCRWWIASGKSMTGDNRWYGKIEVYDTKKEESLVKSGGACCIAEVDVYDKIRPLLVVVDAKEPNRLLLSITQMDSEPDLQRFIPVEVCVPFHAENDSPVRVTVFDRLPIVVVSTHKSSLYFFELHTGASLHSIHNLDCILPKSVDGHSVINRRPDRRLERISVNETDLIGWVRRVLKDDTLASAIAIRTGLPGADDVLVNDMHGVYTQTS